MGRGLPFLFAAFFEALIFALVASEWRFPFMKEGWPMCDARILARVSSDIFLAAALIFARASGDCL